MKKFVFVLLLLVATLAYADVIKRGAPLTKGAKVIPIADVMKDPEAHAQAPIVIEGRATSACENKGCWLQIEGGLHMTFKDYGFFVPTNSKGMTIRAEGQVEVKTLSKEEADHLEGEGAKLHRAKDGTAKEVTFVATGVELTK